MYSEHTGVRLTLPLITGGPGSSPALVGADGLCRAKVDQTRAASPRTSPRSFGLRVTPQPEPPREEVDWGLYLWAAAWRPFNREHFGGFNFEKGGGGVLEWGSRCVYLCQWAPDADTTGPIEYNPPENGRVVARHGGALPEQAG